MTRRFFFFRTLATMIALRVPWGIAKASACAEIRLGVPIVENGKLALLQIAGPEWRLIKKWVPKDGVLDMPKLTKRWGLTTILEANLPFDQFSRDRLNRLVASHSGVDPTKMWHWDSNEPQVEQKNYAATIPWEQMHKEATDAFRKAMNHPEVPALIAQWEEWQKNLENRNPKMILNLETQRYEFNS